MKIRRTKANDHVKEKKTKITDSCKDSSLEYWNVVFPNSTKTE